MHTCMYQIWNKISLDYSLVHLVVAKLEELISRTLLGPFKIRLLFQDRVMSQNLRLASLICQTYKSMSSVSAQIYLKYARSSGSIVTVWCKRKIAGGENCHINLRFCDLTRSWNSNRILNRPSNVREISSSNFATTRCTRLYVFFFVFVFFKSLCWLLSSPKDKISENIWFLWSKTSYSGEKVG